jgi:hypothetical protein
MKLYVSKAPYTRCSTSLIKTPALAYRCDKYTQSSLLTYNSTVLLVKLTGLLPVNKFPKFYGTRRSLPHLQLRATCLFPEPVTSNPYTILQFVNIHPNVIPSTPDSPSWSLSLSSSHQNPVCTSYFPPRHTCSAYFKFSRFIT